MTRDGVPCGVVLYNAPDGWTLRRNPKCNRPHGHRGPHREYDRRTAAVRAEWSTRVAS